MQFHLIENHAFPLYVDVFVPFVSSFPHYEQDASLFFGSYEGAGTQKSYDAADSRVVIQDLTTNLVL